MNYPAASNRVSNGINFFTPRGGELIPCPPFGGLKQKEHYLWKLTNLFYNEYSVI